MPGGELSTTELLQLRIRYFTDGLVIGSSLFVEKYFLQYRAWFGKKRKTGPRPIRGFKPEGLHALRALRLLDYS